MQADAFSGYNALYEKGRKPAPVVETAWWAHGKRDFFDFAKLTKAPIAVEIVRRIDELFAIERAINGKSFDERRAARQERSKPLVAALEGYMREQLERLSPKNDLAKAIHYMLTRWPSFTRFLVCSVYQTERLVSNCRLRSQKRGSFHNIVASPETITSIGMRQLGPRRRRSEVMTFGVTHRGRVGT